VKFRAKIFLAIILPSSALVAVAVGVALYHLARTSEETAREELDRTSKAFKLELQNRLVQMANLTESFKGPRFDAAVTEAVVSKDIATVDQLLNYQYKLIGYTPNYYEVRDKSGVVLLRKCVDPVLQKADAGPVQKWTRERGSALTEFAGQPYLAVAFDHEKGTLLVGNDLRSFLEYLKDNFRIDLGLLKDGKVVYRTDPLWTPEAKDHPGRRYLSAEGTPINSELTPVLFLKNMDEADSQQRSVLWAGFGGLAVSVLVALLVSIMVSRGVSTPVEKLVAAANQIAQGDYKVKVEIGTRDEIGGLGKAFNEMTEGLRKRQEIMDKTLSRDVAEEFLKGGDRPAERRVVTIVFMDIRGYTSGTEGMDPAEVVVMLNELMDLLSGAIVRHGGIVNKFLGDGLMAMFGAPKPLEGHALKAVLAGLEMQKWMARWNDRRIARGLPAFFSGIGINTGEAMCGKVGAQDRMEYTLIGEEVNLASRICGKAAPKQVLVTNQTWMKVSTQVKGRELEPVQVKGLSYPIKVFEVLE